MPPDYQCLFDGLGKVGTEAVGSASQGIVNGVNDNAGLVANTVIALENFSTPSKVTCSGPLIAPFVVPTTATCIDTEYVGVRPKVSSEDAR